jgi:lantibiotic leader peptide-processing serine protease
MPIHRLPLLAVLAFALAACSDSSMLSPKPSAAVNPNLPQAARYLVRLSAPGPVPSALQKLIATDGGRIVRAHAGTGLVTVAGLSAASAGSLRGQAGVAAVAADMHRQWIHQPVASERMQLMARAGANARSSMAGLVHARGAPASAPAYLAGAEWWVTRIGADTAWATTSQGAGQTIYVLDTGVDTTHQELVGHVNTTLSTSFATAPSGDSVLPFGHDVAGHGTFVTSIITGNAVEVAAIAPQTKVAMVRVLDDSGSGNDSDILTGILYAADNGATVISMSLGGYIGRSDGSDLAFGDFFQRIVDYAVARGALVVVAAGNEGVNTNTGSSTTGSFADSLNLPAGLNHLMSIGATGPIEKASPDQIAFYSNFGKADVAIFAPGGNNDDVTYEQDNNFPDWIIGACSSASATACAGESSYNAGIGTSFATPMVSAEAAIMLALNSGMSPATLEACILNNAATQGSGKGDANYDFGRISIPAAAKATGC